MRRALVRLAIKPATISDKEKLEKLRSDYHLAKKNIGRKEEILSVSFDWSFGYKCILKIICRIYPNRTWKRILPGAHFDVGKASDGGRINC
jgi:hypothetical protein